MYIILGAILGIFVVACIVALKIIFSNKVQTRRDLATITHGNMLGLIESKSSQSRTAALISKLRGRKKLEQDQWIDIICANVKSDTAVKESGNIYLTGSAWENLDSSIIDAIVAKLSEKGISVQCGGNISYDTASFEKILEIKNVMLIEAVGKSVRSEIQKELELINKLDVHIVGYVVVE